MRRYWGMTNRATKGGIKVPFTIEKCADIDWFSQRYPITPVPPNLIAKNVQRFKERELLLQNILGNEYVPQPFEMALPPRSYQARHADACFAMHGLLNADDLGLGKALDVDAKILTPSGWRRNGDIRVGDTICSPFHGTATVLGVYPQGVCEMYRVETADGGATNCTLDHLWQVHTSNDRRRGTSRVRPLWMFKDFLTATYSGQKLSQYFLPVAEAATFKEQGILPIDPYLLGALLGDGHLGRRRVGFSNIDEEIIGLVRSKIPNGLLLVPNKRSCDYRITNGRQATSHILLRHFRSLGLAGTVSNTKFIPERYRLAAPSDRLELLRGLMDTDGYCEKNGASCIYSSVSRQLIEDIAFVVGSLGGFTSMYSKIKYFTHKGIKKAGQPVFELNIRLPVNPFRCARKANRWRQPYLARPIKKVEFVGYKEAQCIAVSTQDGLYITDDFIVTHNTASAISLLSRPECRPGLVVVPTHLARQWRDEFAKFTPNLMAHIIKTGKLYELPQFFGQPPDVLIITYHKLSKWTSVLSKFARTVVFDEVQALRHEGSDRYAAAEIVAGACKWRMGLSATPIYNYGGEFFNIARVLRPGLLGSRQEFDEAWCSGYGNKVKIKDPRAFGSYLRDSGFMIQHTRKDVGRELPAVTKIVQNVDCDQAALDKIQGDAVRLAKLILSETKLERGAAMQASDEFDLKLRQATGIAKAPYVADFVRMLCESGERIVLAGWHRGVYDIWLEKLKDLRVVMFTGSETPAQKENAKKQFMRHDADVFILSLRSGEGLDGLQKASSVIVFGELDWAHGVMEQNVGRLNRDGQESPVLAYYLVSEGGMDPYMSQILGLKRSQLVGLRDPDAPIVEPIQTVDPDRVKRLAEAYLASLSHSRKRDEDDF